MALFRIKNNLYRKRSFWVSRKWLNEKPVFTFWKTLFRGHYSLTKSKDTFLLLLPTLSPFAYAIIYSTFIIVILESYSYFFPKSFSFISFDTQAVDTFLATVASIAGVFLGLYFTAISSIASNFLTRARPDVRNFFLSAPRGKQYVKTVALTGIVSIFYIVVKSFGHERDCNYSGGIRKTFGLY